MGVHYFHFQIAFVRVRHNGIAHCRYIVRELNCEYKKTIIMSKNILTIVEIIEKLKLISGSKSAANLTRKLGTERQNLKFYEIKSAIDLNNRIISLLIDKLEQD